MENEVLQEKSIENSVENSVESYLAYADEQIKKYREISNLIRNNEITPAEINEAMARYSDVNLMLIAEHQRAMFDHNIIDLDYQEWWDEKFVKMRRELNPIDLAGTKWLAIKEVNSEVRVAHKEEYKQWRTIFTNSEIRLAFVKGLLDNWKKFDAILIQTSKNLQSEMRTLSLDSRINQKEDYVRTEFPTRQRTP